jgi:hypothetical protein
MASTVSFRSPSYRQQVIGALRLASSITLRCSHLCFSMPAAQFLLAAALALCLEQNCRRINSFHDRWGAELLFRARFLLEPRFFLAGGSLLIFRHHGAFDSTEYIKPPCLAGKRNVQ